MKPSVAQSRIIMRMADGARLTWNSRVGSFQLADSISSRTIQGRTVDALDAGGLIARDVLGDCALTPQGHLLASAGRTSSDGGVS